MRELHGPSFGRFLRSAALLPLVSWLVAVAAILAPLLIVPATPSVAASRSAAVDAFDQNRLRGLEWRCIGPYRGGRVTAVTGVVGQRNVYYFGGTGSGIWKSQDNGASWQNVSDGQLGTGSVGAIAVAETDPNLIYVGMGEGCIRGNVSHGDGVYRSTDAGRTWKHVGLADSRQIPRIRIHPRDPDLVYVAALGHTFGPNRERGIFRSSDGGSTWKHVLFVNDSTGGCDLVIDPRNPRVLYATTWQAHRTPWKLESGGPGSALYKSTDGGDTWKKLTGEGLPKGLWGRVGVAVSPADPDRVWAMIEAQEGGLYRSDDAGRTWRRTNEDRNLRQRAWYYTHVYADPANADVVYVLNVDFHRSKDGGRTFQAIDGPHGDWHDLWIDPRDPLRMVMGDDGGTSVSLDGGISWSGQETQPTAQFYHVITDDQFPYHVYGAQQDNSTVGIASRTRGFGIGPNDWFQVGGGECGYIAPKPGEPDVVYAGSYNGYLTRLDRRVRQQRNVNVYPENPMGWGAEGAKYRFQWTFPIVISPHDPNTVYAASNVLFKSTNEGQSWQAISPDLTRNDAAKLGPSGGPITKDNTSVEYYCTIFALAESKRAKGLLWAGTDDGLIQVSRDGGVHWTNVTPRSLPPWSMVSQIDPSPHDPATAYVAVNRYKLDDYQPYVFVTHDYGKSWRLASAGIPEGSFVRAVREDPVRKHLLYAGTETGVYFSIDDGARWRPLRMNLPGRMAEGAKPEENESKGALPIVPVTDLVVQGQDLVVATQGRSFWILDDVEPLRQMAAEAPAGAQLFTPSPAVLFGGAVGTGAVGRNPPNGAMIQYHLASEPKENEEITLEFLDAAGKSIRKFSSKPKSAEEGEESGPGGGPGGARREPKLPARAGLNRFAWDMRHPEASRFKGMILWGGGLSGPTVVPGTYQARLTAGGASVTRSFEVRKDPRLSTTPEDYKKRFDLHLAIRDKLTETHDAITRLRDVREQLKAVSERSRIASRDTASRDTAIAAASRALVEKITSVEEALYQTKNKSSQDPLNYPIRLNNKLSNLVGVVNSADAAPTDQAIAVHREVTSRIDDELAKLRKLLGEDLVAFNRLVREREIPAVVVKESKTAGAGADAAPGQEP